MLDFTHFVILKPFNPKNSLINTKLQIPEIWFYYKNTDKTSEIQVTHINFKNLHIKDVAIGWHIILMIYHVSSSSFGLNYLKQNLKPEFREFYLHYKKSGFLSLSLKISRKMFFQKISGKEQGANRSN